MSIINSKMNSCLRALSVSVKQKVFTHICTCGGRQRLAASLLRFLTMYLTTGGTWTIFICIYYSVGTFDTHNGCILRSGRGVNIFLSNVNFHRMHQLDKWGERYSNR